MKSKLSSVAQVGIVAICIALLAGVIYSWKLRSSPLVFSWITIEPGEVAQKGTIMVNPPGQSERNDIPADIPDVVSNERAKPAEKADTKQSEKSLIDAAVDPSFLGNQDHHNGKHWAVKAVLSGTRTMPERNAQLLDDASK